jgi:predicted HicB family RNase H-like nuclease
MRHRHTPQTVNFTLRLDPDVHELLREAATQEERSMANMVAFLIRRYAPAYLPSAVGGARGKETP